MSAIAQIKPHMRVIGADGVHVGTVDAVEGSRIKLTRADSGSHNSHHHYLSEGLIAGIEGEEVRLTANGAVAALMEEEKGGQPIMDGAGRSWGRIGAGVAAGVAVAVAGLTFWRRRNAPDREQNPLL